MITNSRIKILDKITANQIAAGEVIEAPNSVVKELVENSIDAGSTWIEIKVERGGIDLIIVQDNGIGMSKEDLMLAFERHATSKITTAGDLGRLTTLGFRGEALPSIASVAKIKVVAKTAADLTGWQLNMEDGKILSCQEKGCNRGTTIEVAELFYNTPARKKYLKSPLTEMAGITDIVSKLALAHPQISFTLISNGRQILKTPGTNNLIDVITSIWGPEMSTNLIYVSGEREKISITGYVGSIAYHRPNRKGELFFVNNRFVKSKLIAQGLEEGYRTLLPINRFPFGILVIAIDPEEIDVNIHPTKLEVKFLSPEEIKNTVTEIISATVQRDGGKAASDFKHLVSLEARPAKSFIAGIGDSIYVPETNKLDEDQASFTRTNRFDEDQVSFTSFTSPEYPNPPSFPALSFNKEEAESYANFDREEPCPENESSPSYFANPIHPDHNFLAEQNSLEELKLFKGIKPLGQFKNTYIVCEGEEGLFLIDQHAAHERIIYHKLIAQQDLKISSQQLLFPITVELTPSEADLVVEYILNLRELGFILEHFGGNTLVIREVPQDLPKGLEQDCFYQLLELFNKESFDNPMAFRDKALILIACKTAIKAGKVLSTAEINFLLTELVKTLNFATCPHGRPTIISFSHDFIAKKFIRN